MRILDLREGISDNDDYKAFLFKGGEVHFILKNPVEFYSANEIQIISSITNSDQLMLLLLAIDTIKKDNFYGKLKVYLTYMAYQQADRDFSLGESFSLKTIATILNSLGVDQFSVFDPHSDVTPALLNHCNVIDNSLFIEEVLQTINNVENDPTGSKGAIKETQLVILSPDAGAYKKIGKLASKLCFLGEVANANKYRSISSGNIESIEFSKQDFGGRDVLIIDDICVGGRTFISLAEKLKERNCGKLYLAISHGVFSNGLFELNKYFDGIFTTNSRIDYFNNEYFKKNNSEEMYKFKVFEV